MKKKLRINSHLLIDGNYNMKLRHTGINSQWKVKHAGKKNGRNVPLEKVTLSKQGRKMNTRPYSVISVSCLLSLQVRVSFMLLSALQGQWSLFVFLLKDAPSPTICWHERYWNCFIICDDEDENDNFLFPMCNCSSISKKPLVFSSKWRKIKWVWKN